MTNAQIYFSSAMVLILMQRMAELRIARRNTQALLLQGALEFGREHYWVLLTLHIGFFAGLLLESSIGPIQLSSQWRLLLAVFLAAQAARIWVIHSLEGRWTTRVIALPGKKLVKRGPFRYLSHPNYLVVGVEFLTFPLMFGLWRTAILFSVLNGMVLLLIRLPVENKALKLALK